MTQAYQLSDLGQLLTVDTVGNNITLAANSFVVGNASVNATINSTAFTGTANNTSYFGGVAASSYVNTSGSYTISGIHTHTANLIVNAVLSVNNEVVSGNGFYSNSTFAGAPTYGDGIVVDYVTGNGRISVGSADGITLYTNGVAGVAMASANTSGFYIANGGVNAASFNVSTSTIANSTGVYTGVVNATSITTTNAYFSGSANIAGNLVVSGNVAISGNLTISGNTVSIGANNLAVLDSVISLHTQANLAPWTTNDGQNIGVSFHYYNGADSQALLDLDNSSGRLIWWANSTDAILGNPSGTALGTFQANTLWVGTNTVYTVVNSTGFSGTANNSLYLGGTAAANFVQNSGAYTISGVHTHTANVVLAGLIANGSIGSSGQYLTSNGSSTYWSAGSSYTFGTGLVNSSGTITVDSSYIAKISANNASYLGGVAASSYALLSGPTFTGTTTTSALTVNGGFYQGSGYAYIGYYNSAGAYPSPANSLGIGSNFTNGNSEINLWNTYNPSTYSSTGFRFMQQLTSSTYRDLMFLRQDGYIGFGTISPIRPIHFNNGTNVFEMSCSGSSSSGTSYFNISDSSGSNGGGWSYIIRGLASSGSATVNLSGMSIYSNLLTVYGGLITSGTGGFLSSQSGLTNEPGSVSATNWFRTYGATGLYWESYGRGISPTDGFVSYGNLCVYGSGLNGWQGISFTTGNNTILMGNGSSWGVYNPSTSVWMMISDYSGNVTFNGNVAAYSDLRLKQNVQPIDNITQRRNTLALSAIKYERDGRTRIGYGAQTLRDNGCSEFVMEQNDSLKLVTGLGTLSVDYGETSAILAVASKNTDDKVDALEQRIAYLESVISNFLGDKK